MYPTIELVYDWLTEHAMPLLMRRVHEEVMALMPSSMVVVKVDEALTAMREFHKTTLFLAAPLKVREELQGVYDTINAISSGFSPNTNDINGYGTMGKEIMNKAQYFADIELCSGKGIQKHKTMQLPLKGAEGLQTHYLALESACSKGGTVRLEQLKPLKMFAWLLSSKQQSTVTKSIQTAPRAGISNAMLTGKASTLASPLVIKAPPASFKKDVKSGTASSSSTAKPAAPKSMEKPEVDPLCMEVADSSRALVRGFFSKKKRVCCTCPVGGHRARNESA